MKALRSFIQRVAATVERHRMFAPGQRIGVAVSGGSDSVCLLHVLLELRAPSLTVMHLDHGLRGEESRADAAFVREMAAGLGLPIVAREATIVADGNLEQNARRARLAFFRETIASGAVDRVAVGHTRSDQAETVLFRLLRGSGTAGLAAVRPVTADGIVRPLIEVERAEVEDYLRGRGIAWREDSTNSSPRFARNRIRHSLLPSLARDWNPEIIAALARTADQAAADEAYWSVEIDRLSTGRLTVEDGAPVLKASDLAALPEAVARRLVRRAIEQAKGDLLTVDFRHIDEVLRLARSASGTGRVQAPGLDIRRSFDLIRFGGKPARPYRVPLDVPGAVAIPGTNRAICLELIDNSETLGDSESVYNGEMGFVDWGRVSGSLELRSWMPGDRIRPMGSSGIKNFKTLFQSARIPSWERVPWPLLVDGSAIVWSRRFGPAAEYAAGPQSRTILRIREAEAEC
jgi:tRNA(Ile)-lysidine synthase